MKKAIKINVEQNSSEWHKARLGNFTASAVHKLMVKGRGKDQVFGSAALDYIDETAAGRMVSASVLEDEALWNDYLDRTYSENRACRWGHDNEATALRLYAATRGVNVEPGGMYRHPDLPTLTASPDALAGNDGLVEIKCPYTSKNFVKYTRITDADSLKSTSAEYYWQVMCQLAVTGRKWCDFVVYDPALSYSLHVARIERNEDDIAALLERVEKANNLVLDILTPIVNYLIDEI